jgi:hypothetical protein
MVFDEVEVEQEQRGSGGYLFPAGVPNGLEEFWSEGDRGGGVAVSPRLMDLPAGIVERERQRDAA